MASRCWGPWWWLWWRCSLATVTGKRARSISTWQWATVADDWTVLSMSCQMSLRATVTTTPTPATTPYHSAHRTPHPLRRFQAVSSLPASKPLSDQVEPTDLITMPRYLQTGSTVGSPRQGLWTEVAATWTEATAIATATVMASAHSTVKDPSLKRGWGPAWLP